MSSGRRVSCSRGSGLVGASGEPDSDEYAMSIPIAAPRCPECVAQIAPATEQPQPIRPPGPSLVRAGGGCDGI